MGEGLVIMLRNGPTAVVMAEENDQWRDDGREK